jgi:hypothetical protein
MKDRTPSCHCVRSAKLGEVYGTHSSIVFSPLAFPVIVIVSAVSIPSRISAPRTVIPGIFASVPLAVVGHSRNVRDGGGQVERVM